MREDRNDNHLERPMPWLRLLLVTGVILILLPCLGLVSSVAYLKARQDAAMSRWQSLGTPPEIGTEIITGDIDVVYLRTATGNIYGCKHGGRKASGECWFEAQEPLNVDSKARFDQRLYQGEVDPPSGTVVDRLEVTVWYAEDAFETRYVLLEDSSVWKWEYDVGAYFSLTIVILGLVIGLVIGIVLVVIIWVGTGIYRHNANR